MEAWLGGGGDVDARDEEFESTLLMTAAVCGHKSIVEMLLGRKAAVDLEALGGYTALMGAATNGHTAVARRLLAADAKTELRNALGETALQWAERHGHTECARYLRMAVKYRRALAR